MFNLKDAKKIKVIDCVFIALMFAWAFFLNRGIRIAGLYQDDLYMWSCFGEQSLKEFCFPESCIQFRPVFWFVQYLELLVVGNHFGRIVKLNIILLVLIVIICYFFLIRICGHRLVAFFLSMAIIASRFSYYQVATMIGVLEALGMLFAILVCIMLYFYLHEGKAWQFYLSVLFYLLVIFTHERYLVLLPMFYYALIVSKDKHLWRYIAPAAVFLFNLFARLKFTGKIIPSGTGGTEVTDTFTFKNAIESAVSELKYLVGINAGPEYLNGIPFEETTDKFKALVYAGIIVLAVILGIFLFTVIVKAIKGKSKESRVAIRDFVFLLGFIIGCVTCSSITIRVEMRWIYPSFCFLCFILAFIYGYMQKNSPVLRVIMLVAVILLSLIFTCEDYVYRKSWNKIYFFPMQAKYNSLADETFGKYGEDVLDMKVYVIGDTYEMTDFYNRYFLKTFDPKREKRGNTIVHVNSIDEIPEIDSKTIVLQEDPAHDAYVKVR